MSELMNARRTNIRWELLTTVSALAFFVSPHDIGRVQAAESESGQPTIWIELGAQLDEVRGFGDPYAVPFSPQIVADGFISPIEAQRALSQAFGISGAVTFQPKESDWIFSAAVRYGRANGGKKTQEQTPGGPRHVMLGSNTGYLTPHHGTIKFSDTRVSNNETHAIVDFQAGKDFGLGLFGRESTSTISFGVRFAQFTSKQTLDLRADPDFYFPYKFALYPKYHHTYSVSSHMNRSFRGLGPSISWNAAAPVLGNADDGGIFLDWGINAAVLFGRQKAQGHHQTTGGLYKSNYLGKYHFTSHIHRSGSPDRARTVTVPNVGGFAGVSFRYSNAKVSFGYRGDFFFGAMDGGVDEARRTTIGFYGPFASVSVGLGG